MSAFKFVSYALDPSGTDWLPIDVFIRDSNHLERELNRLIAEKPKVIDFLAPNGDLLNLGIGGPVGYAAFATSDMQSEGSTVSANGTVNGDIPDWVEFEMGGTPTPINREGLVTAAELIAIARYFFDTGGLHPGFSWE